ncbi:MAG: lipid II flippase MurJ [Ethanoligenens sp.]
MKTQWKKWIAPVVRNRSILAVVFINILLAAVALFKDIILAAYLGTSAQADAFTLAFFIPDMVGNNLVAAAVGVSCVPLFARLHQDKPAGLRNLVIAINLLVSGVMVILAVLLFGFGGQVVAWVGAGFPAAIKASCTRLLLIMLPTVLLYPLAAVGLSVLQVRARYLGNAFAPVLFNGLFLAGIAGCLALRIPIETGVYIIAVCVLAAEGIVALYIGVLVITSGDRRPAAPFRAGAFCEAYGTLRLSFDYVLILLFSQGVMYVERFLFSQAGEGSVAALNYAYRIAQFPVWVFASAVMLVVFPQLSRAVSADPERAQALLGKAVYYTLLLNIPILIALFVLRVPIVTIVFEHGSFGAASVRITASILGGYALTILGQSFSAVMIRYIIAANRTRPAVWIYLTTAVVNIAVDLLFVRIWGVYSIGYGSALASILTVALLLLHFRMGTQLRAGLPKLLTAGLANLAMLAICILCLVLWNFCFHNAAFPAKILFAFCGALTACAVYGASLKACTRRRA